MTPSETPKASQASECSELPGPMRASCWISNIDAQAEMEILRRMVDGIAYFVDGIAYFVNPMSIMSHSCSLQSISLR